MPKVSRVSRPPFGQTRTFDIVLWIVDNQELILYIAAG